MSKQDVDDYTARVVNVTLQQALNRIDRQESDAQLKELAAEFYTMHKPYWKYLIGL